jgi:hypothetical protein
MAYHTIFYYDERADFLHIFMFFEIRLIGSHGNSNTLYIYIYIYLAIVMSVLRFTDSIYPFGIFKIFLIMTNVDNLWCTDLLMSEIIVVTLLDSICSLLTFMSG